MEGFNSYQNPSAGASGSSAAATATATTMTEAEFQKLAQSIGTNVQKIQQNVTSMQRMISQIGTAQDNQQFQQQLHQIQHYTGQLAKDTAAHIQTLSAAAAAASTSSSAAGAGGDAANTTGGTAGSSRRRRLQRERLQNDFTKALNSFQAAQRTAAQKEKEAIKRARQQANQGLPAPGQQQQGGANLIDIEGGGAGGSDPNAFLPPGQSKTQMLLQEEQDLEQLQERERGIRQLESDIIDVNTIFKDLATMVHEQGEMVDSIEANVDSTHVRVSEGTEQLRQAEQYKNKARRKKFILAIVGLIILIILIAIVASQFN